jgi:phage terminase large subunit-like protein
VAEPPALPDVDRLARLPRAELELLLAELPDELAARALYAWPLWARPDQPELEGVWRVWLTRSGCGAGKTRAGAEWVRAKAEAGVYGRFNLVWRTAADVRLLAVVEAPVVGVRCQHAQRWYPTAWFAARTCEQPQPLPTQCRRDASSRPITRRDGSSWGPC